MTKDFMFTCGNKECGHLWKRSDYIEATGLTEVDKQVFVDGQKCPKCGGDEVYSKQI